MSRSTLLARRSVARRGLLLLVWLLVAGLAASLGVTVGYVRAAGVDDARTGLTAAAPSGRGLLLVTRLAADDAAAAAQEARVAEALDERLGGTPYAVYRETRTEGLPVVRAGAPLEQRWVVSTPALLAAGTEGTGGTRGGGSGDEWAPVDRGIADTTAGTWPQATPEGEPPQAAVQADAAAAAGIEVGDTLLLGADDEDPAGTGTPVVVSGLWRVTTGADASRWFGDPVTTTGGDGTVAGPILLAGSAFAELDTTPFARWLVVPDAGGVTPADLERSVTLADDLDAALADDDAVAIRGFQALGTLGDTARTTLTAIRAAEAVALVALVLLALTGLVALVQVARLLAAVRDGEVALLVSRGADPGTVRAAATAESAVLAVTASAAGVVAAAFVLQALEPGAWQWPVLLVTAAAVALAATAVPAVVAGAQARAAVRRRITDRSGRVRQVAAVGTVVLTLAAAAVCAQALVRYGSPLVTTPSGTRTDPLAAAAPALLLAALAVAAMAVLGPATRAWAGLAARGRGAGGVLAARQVARRLVVYVVPVVLLALSGGAATLAGAYAGTARALSEDVAVLRNGADVRVVLPAGQEAGTETQAAYARGHGVAAAMPVLTDEAQAGEVPFTLVAAPATDLEEVMRAPEGVSDVGRLAAAVTPDRAAIPLPGDARLLRLDVTASVEPAVVAGLAGFEGEAPTDTELLGHLEEGMTYQVAVLLVAPDGATARVDLPPMDLDLDGDGDGTLPVGRDPVSHELAARVPPAPEAGPWSVAAVDVAMPTDWVLEAHHEVAVEGLAVDGAPLRLPEEWHALHRGGETLALPEASAGAGRSAGPVVEVDLVGGDRDIPVRLLPGATASPLPVVVTDHLARTLSLGVGDVVELSHRGAAADAEIAATTDVVPGVLEPDVVLADAAALAAWRLGAVADPAVADEIWIAAGAPGGSATPDAPTGAPAPAGSGIEAAAATARETADGLRGDDGETATVSTPGYSVAVDAAAPVRVAYWLTAVGATTLALVGVLVAAVAMLRQRRTEVIVLRAVGVGPMAQARARATELMAVGATAVVLGAAAGWGVARFAVGGLAQATLTGIDADVPTRFVVEGTGLAVVLGAALAGLVVVAGLVGARVAAQARDTTYREEVR
ncbi:FtsX-like permease family protein [Myceligenerans xiligouense]|uniref:FtsX-like permease family protein n=1 Tax=Myceligenerans xiligouense TaxID=253184 RepID=UPI000F509579|nr:FtsX-like permease family protein [Myceligenerans xiligouense]